jgi:cation diffusion facilitator CzcD-associated flavoprotein CzcO
VPYRVVVIGAGFGGIGMAIALKKAGIDDFVVLERAGDLGGTWRDNSYPGLTCDIPSQLYSFSFRSWRWSRRFPARDEILAYLHSLAAEHGLDQNLRFHAEVTSADWDEGAATWNLTLADGAVVAARALVCAAGQLSGPALPGIGGRDDFAGPSWHSARWNHDVDLTDKRVAVIGTGASAVQFVPEIAATAGRVDVYQRSAPYVLPKLDRPYRKAELDLFDRVPLARKISRLSFFLILESLSTGFFFPPAIPAAKALWRRHLHGQVTDPGLRARCTPDYVMGCKRVTFSNDWYPALTRSNVNIINHYPERIFPDALVASDGITRPADVIIYATGFRSTEFLAPMTVTGRGGRSLNEAWRDGAEAYLGITVSGFPNFFLLYGPGTNLGGNSIIFMHESQIRYVMGALRTLASREALSNHGAAWLDVRPDAQRRYADWHQAASRRTTWVTGGCHNWYTASGRNTNNWPSYTFRYRQRTRHFDPAAYRFAPFS